MNLSMFRDEKRKKRVEEAENLTPGKRIEQAIFISELCMELRKAAIRHISERRSKKGCKCTAKN